MSRLPGMKLPQVGSYRILPRLRLDRRRETGRARLHRRTAGREARLLDLPDDSVDRRSDAPRRPRRWRRGWRGNGGLLLASSAREKKDRRGNDQSRARETAKARHSFDLTACGARGPCSTIRGRETPLVRRSRARGIRAVDDAGTGDRTGHAPRSRGRFRRQAPRHRPDRHRQRARRPDVVRPTAAVLERDRSRGPDRDDVDVAEGEGPARHVARARRRVRRGAIESAAARGRMARGGDSGRHRGVRPASLWNGGRRGGQDVTRRAGHHPRRRSSRPAAPVGHRLGRRQHAGPGARRRARDAVGRRARPVPRQAQGLLHLGPGRCRPVDPPRVPGALLRREALPPERRGVPGRHLDRHQRRRLLPQLRGRGSDHRHERLARGARSSQGPPRQALPEVRLHHGGRHAFVSGPHPERL